MAKKFYLISGGKGVTIWWTSSPGMRNQPSLWAANLFHCVSNNVYFQLQNPQLLTMKSPLIRLKILFLDVVMDFTCSSSKGWRTLRTNPSRGRRGSGYLKPKQRLVSSWSLDKRYTNPLLMWLINRWCFISHLPPGKRNSWISAFI